MGTTEQEARQEQNLRGDLLILNKTIFLIPCLYARLTMILNRSLCFPLCPVQVTGSLVSFTSLCKSMFPPDLIRRHNDPADDFHLDFHKMVCIAFKTDGGMPECNTAVCNF